MPYSTISELPDTLKALPAHAKEIYMKAFNSAYKTYNGEEHKAHATAWTAVERSYKKENGKWVARESAGDLSDENKRDLLQAALITEYQLDEDKTIPRGVLIEEVFDEELIYSVNGQAYKASYVIGESGEIVIGNPEKVIAQKVYKPMESLQATYSEIIQEAGRRNASLDSVRIKRIVELCQELLSSEDMPDEVKIKKAVKEAAMVLTWVKEQAAMKTEDGIKFPASAFAYASSPGEPNGWKLRLWEDLDKKVTRAQLGRAAAALSPGGFRGQKVAIPSADLPTVKRKIRSAYRTLGVEEEDIPRWVKEAMVRDKYPIYTPLTEAEAFDDKGRATVIVIKAGFNEDKSRYYPAEMLKRDYKVFEGLKMYADHPTETEEKELPERSIKPSGFVAKLVDVTCDENGTVTGVADIIESWLMKKLAIMRDKNMLSEMGISINALGRGSKTTIEGVETLVIEKLTGARSVDFVTEPGANGIVTFYESDRGNDIDLIEISTLREKRPDLVKSIEATVRAEVQQEVKHKMELEEKVTELEGQVTTLTTERDALKEAALKAEKDKAKADAQASIKEAVEKAESLPSAAKERLIERFKDAESAEGIEEAIQSEVNYIAKLSEAGKVKGLGTTKVDPEKGKESLRESFKNMHPEWTDAQVETAVTGR